MITDADRKKWKWPIRRLYLHIRFAPKSHLGCFWHCPLCKTVGRATEGPECGKCICAKILTDDEMPDNHPRIYCLRIAPTRDMPLSVRANQLRVYHNLKERVNSGAF